jgi:hypothetical protein
MVEQLTRIAADAAGDPTLASRTWVLLTEAPDGGWGLDGHANTNEELVLHCRPSWRAGYCGDACVAPRSWPAVEDAAGRFAQGGGASLEGGALVAGHGRLVELLDAAGAEHTDQRQGHLIAW